jgi:hypothetical protein
MVNPNVSQNELAATNVASAVSWGAIFAGAASIATLSTILLILGTGLGMSVVSPWAYHGVSATTFGVTAIAWLTFTQLFASGMGGYLAGRLRTKWAAVHSDEVYFRDTAHGFLAWAVAMLITAAILTSMVGSIVSGGVQAGATVAGGVATATGAATAGVATSAASAASGLANSGTDDGSMNYLIDSLFRKNLSADSSDSAQDSNSDKSDTGTNAREVARIFINSIQTGNLPKEDIRYISQLVAKHTDITQEEAEKRVKETYAQMQEKLEEAKTAAKEAADTARKASAYVSLWLFISLLTGAFVASLAATYGGRQRDL